MCLNSPFDKCLFGTFLDGRVIVICYYDPRVYVCQNRYVMRVARATKCPRSIPTDYIMLFCYEKRAQIVYD